MKDHWYFVEDPIWNAIEQDKGLEEVKKLVEKTKNFEWEDADNSLYGFGKTILHHCIDQGHYNRYEADNNLSLFTFLVQSGAHSCLFVRDQHNKLGGHYADLQILDNMKGQQITVMVWSLYLRHFMEMIGILPLAEIMRDYICGDYSPSNILNSVDLDRSIQHNSDEDRKVRYPGLHKSIMKRKRKRKVLRQKKRESL